MTIFEAVQIVEMEPELHTEDEVLEAWQWLIDTGHAWHLQGWYGRTAAGLIDEGSCRPAPGEGK